MICVIDCGTTWLDDILENISRNDCQSEVVRMGGHLNEIDFSQYSGVVITGASILLAEDDGTHVKNFEFLKNIKIPVLGICFGHQVMGMVYGVEIESGEMIDKMETINIKKSDGLLEGVTGKSFFQKAHSEFITVPNEFDLLAMSDSCSNEVMKYKTKDIYGVQFHPEVSGEAGKIIFDNFLKMTKR